MSNSKSSVQRRVLHWLRHFVKTREAISVAKAVIAYMIVIILLFVPGFRSIFRYPAVIANTVLVSIAGFPGKSNGECFISTIYGLAGVGVGAVMFVVLAELSSAPVAQGFVLAAFLYIMALIKAQGLQYFGFSLLAILLAFGGISTSYITGGFSDTYLEDYLVSYAVAGAIVLAVNLLIFPYSTEKELRNTLCAAINHASTFTHTVDKTFSMALTEDEKKVRDHLNQTIRADYGQLHAKLAGSIIEINYSRWSMQDYGRFVERTKAIQSDLITLYSGLAAVERIAGLELMERNFVKPSRVAFNRLRRIVDLMFTDILETLEIEHTGQRPSNQDSALYQEPDIVDWERDADRPGRALDLSPSQYVEYQNTMEMREQITSVAARLRKEVQHTPQATPAPSRPLTRVQSRSDIKNESPAHVEANLNRVGDRLATPAPNIKDRLKYAEWAFTEFRRIQDEISIKLIESGELLDDDHLAFDTKDKMFPDAYDDTPIGSNVALMRVKGFVFAYDLFIKDIMLLHKDVVRETKPAKRMHFHIYEGLKKGKKPEQAESQRPMSRREALSQIEGRKYTKPKINLFGRLQQLEALALTQTSVYAFKTMLATLVFAVILLAPSSRAFFLNWNLNGGLITIIVAMAPTLGQTFFTFVLQILGVGAGSLFGMAMLEAFHNVGGYIYNPYGICCMTLLAAVPMCWIIVCKPIYFAGGLLALNAAGGQYVIIIANQNVPGYDSPPYRAAKALTAMALALAIALTFQLLILRRSARHALRKSLADILHELLSYHLVFWSLVPAIQPTDADTLRPPPAVVERVTNDLRRREAKIQAQLIELMPLVKFSQVEPSFVKPFDIGSHMALIRNSQIILDRYKEARLALGEGFSDEIRDSFLVKLKPHRKKLLVNSKLGLYLCATALSTKRPLPRDLPKGRGIAKTLFNDAMVLGHNLSMTPEGHEVLLSDAFARYTFYVLSSASAGYNLEQIELALKELFGVLEDEPFEYGHND